MLQHKQGASCNSRVSFTDCENPVFALILIVFHEALRVSTNLPVPDVIQLGRYIWNQHGGLNRLIEQVPKGAKEGRLG
jgi:hypothetical protein